MSRNPILRPMRLVALLALVVSQGWAATPRPVDFNREIRPILSENCLACHGPDAGRRQGKLRLDVADEAAARQAVVPGQPGRSGVVTRVRSEDPDERMPPPDSHKALTPEQKALLERWIAEGAKYERHWAYQRPVRPEVPPGAGAVDGLVRARLAEVGLEPAPEADRRTLIRRLWLDLLGLPPAPAEVEAFERDRSAGAYERLVERALSDPHYGERMAMGWLDVVRFADTIGYHSDNPRNIWPYRDWVIRAFNDNKRFDRFTVEQIAGDLLADADQETRLGSAFNRLGLSTEEGGAQEKDYESRMLTDRVRAVGAAWLGQTTGCAQCHDHKFDPFTTRDFYAMGAFFADLKESIIGRREVGMPVFGPGEAERLARLTRDEERKAFLANVPTCLVSVRSPKPRVVRILPRGNWMDETGEVVQAALPGYLSLPAYEGRPLDRLDLARWLVDPGNPLTARVVMNRLWKQFFGTGLSRVPDDLGAQGELPPNLPLLDWLACEFVGSGWDTKHMVRLLVTSATYRQASSVADLAGLPSRGGARRRALEAFRRSLEQDPYNREHARQSRFRLDAELIRDGALEVSGLLVPTIGGPSVKPYQPDGYWENLNFPTRDYVPDTGAGQYRRGLYTWWQRTFLHPSLLAFDAPSREECAAERSRSNIPQQALVLLNDPTYVEAGRGLALRVITGEGRGSSRRRLERACQSVLQRNPTAAERRTLAGVLEAQRAEYRRDPAAADALLGVGFTPVPEGVDRVELAAWTHVARVLLNLHETLTRP